MLAVVDVRLPDTLGMQNRHSGAAPGVKRLFRSVAGFADSADFGVVDDPQHAAQHAVQLLLLTRGESGENLRFLVRLGVERGQPRLMAFFGQFDDDLPPVGRRRQASDEATLLQRVEPPGYPRWRHLLPGGDLAWCRAMVGTAAGEKVKRGVLVLLQAVVRRKRGV